MQCRMFLFINEGVYLQRKYPRWKENNKEYYLKYTCLKFLEKLKTSNEQLSKWWAGSFEFIQFESQKTRSFKLFRYYWIYSKFIVENREVTHQDQQIVLTRIDLSRDLICFLRIEYSINFVHRLHIQLEYS
jgi:hypothetical protein